MTAIAPRMRHISITGELRNLLRGHTDLKSRYDESHSKFELSRKEVLSLTDRIKILELERDEHLHEKDRLREVLSALSIVLRRLLVSSMSLPNAMNVLSMTSPSSGSLFASSDHRKSSSRGQSQGH